MKENFASAFVSLNAHNKVYKSRSQEGLQEFKSLKNTIIFSVWRIEMRKKTFDIRNKLYDREAKETLCFLCFHFGH